MSEIKQHEQEDIQQDHSQNESQSVLRSAMSLQFAAHEGPLHILQSCKVMKSYVPERQTEFCA